MSYIFECASHADALKEADRINLPEGPISPRIKARGRECPKCGAERFAPCKRASGKVRINNHRERYGK